MVFLISNPRILFIGGTMKFIHSTLLFLSVILAGNVHAQEPGVGLL